MNPYTKYLPSPENQYSPSNPGIDWFSCTNFSVQNLFETYLNRMIQEKTISIGAVRFLSDNGYLDDYGSVNCSDQFNAIMSGTTGQGNTFEKVIDSALKKDGLIPESKFTDNPQTQAEYYDKTKITQAMINLGREFLAHFKIEIVNKNASLAVLKDDLLWMTVSVCHSYNEDPIPLCVMPPSHAVLGYDLDDFVKFFDSYPKYDKRTVPSNIYAKWQLSICEVNQLNSNMKLIKNSKEEKDTYVVGEDNKIRLIYNWETMEELHNAGIVNKDFPPMIEDLDKYERGKDIICVESD